jgi:hypothetical protein
MATGNEILSRDQITRLNKLFKGSVADVVLKLIKLRREMGDGDSAGIYPVISVSENFELDGELMTVKIQVALEAIEEEEEDEDG